ncbi:MAG: hypothetical protein AAF321_09105 [Pseudomonadota bacterium]
MTETPPETPADPATSPRQGVVRMLKLTGLVSVAASVVVIAGVWLVYGLSEFSWHGLAALVLTVFGVTAVNVGLIWLMRVSHNSGRDAEAYEGEQWTQARRKETGWQEYKD